MHDRERWLMSARRVALRRGRRRQISADVFQTVKQAKAVRRQRRGQEGDGAIAKPAALIGADADPARADPGFDAGRFSKAARRSDPGHAQGMPLT